MIILDLRFTKSPISFSLTVAQVIKIKLMEILLLGNNFRESNQEKKQRADTKNKARKTRVITL